MDIRSSQSDINSQSSPCGVATAPSHINAISNGNTITTSRYPSAVSSSPYHNNNSNNGHNSASCSYNNYNVHEQQHIASLLSAVGTLHLLVSELKADQDAFRNETESTIRALSTQAKESEHTIALLRTNIERLETTLDLRQPSSWTAKACENYGLSEPWTRDLNEEEKDENDFQVDGRSFVHRRKPIRIDSRGKETSPTEWESESDSDHQPRGINRNEGREGNSSAPTGITPQPRVDPVMTSGFDGHNPGGNARSLITDATTMMHSEAGNPVDTIASTAEDLLDEDRNGADHHALQLQFIHRNSSMRCIGYCHDIAAPDPIVCLDDGDPVPPQAVPAEIEIKPSTSYHDLSEESSIGAGAALMPSRNDDSVSLISDISFYNHNNNTTTDNRNKKNNKKNAVQEFWCKSKDEEMTRKLEDLKRVIEETRRVSRDGPTGWNGSTSNH